MPNKSLETLAKKAGKSLRDAERYWKEAKESSKDEGFREGSEKFYKYTMSIVMRRLGLSSSIKKSKIRSLVKSTCSKHQKDEIIEIIEIDEEEYKAICESLNIKGRLEKISSRKDNWDDQGSKSPKLESLSRAYIFLENFVRAILENGYIWRTPFITSDESGNLSIEWRKGKHELHIEVKGEKEEFIKVWGANIENEMHVGTLHKTNYAPLWSWLIRG